MESKSSIHFDPVKTNSEAHNDRKYEMGHVRKDLSVNNESWHLTHEDGTKVTIGNRRKEKKNAHLKAFGKQMRLDSHPIKEACLNIKENTTMEDLHRLKAMLEGEFGITVFQMYTHKDEGHHKRTGIKSRLKNGMLNPKWKPNYHAHIVADWTNDDGKMVRLLKEDMRRMQTRTAEVLGMERGKSKLYTNTERKEWPEYKETAEEKQAVELVNEIVELQGEKEQITAEIAKKKSELEELVDQGEAVSDSMIVIQQARDSASSELQEINQAIEDNLQKNRFVEETLKYTKIADDIGLVTSLKNQDLDGTENEHINLPNLMLLVMGMVVHLKNYVFKSNRQKPTGGVFAWFNPEKRNLNIHTNTDLVKEKSQEVDIKIDRKPEVKKIPLLVRNEYGVLVRNPELGNKGIKR
jgi:hypothetical protein